MNDDLLTEARERFKQSADDCMETRKHAEDDIRFARLGDQWPDGIKRQREQENRPCLTVNRMPSFIHQVVNDARQNKPGVIIAPVDGEADEDTAEVIQGLIRNVERRSSAETAYDTAIDHAVSGGFGFFQVSIDYVHEDSFELEARIERIPNPFMVHWDSESTAFDASDWRYAFVSEFLTEDEFKRLYPKADAVSWDAGESRADVSDNQDHVHIVKYWRREAKTRTILRLDTGKTIRRDDAIRIGREQLSVLDADIDVADDDLLAAYLSLMGATVTGEREATYYEVKCYTLSGADVLDTEDWPGSMIPICPVWGEEVMIDGVRHFRSMIRDARDPQVMFNYWRTAATELVALAPKAPWVGPQGFIPKGHEEVWRTANTRSHPYLEYDPTVGAPQRQAFAGIPAGAVQEALNAADDMKATIGIYDASLGARSNETSGRAILARQRESDVANFHFLDNLATAISYAGRVLVEIIPSVYSPRETVRILGEDMTEQVVNLTMEHGEQVDGEQRLYNLAVGKYDVAVSSGPSYATKREEAREFMMELVRSVPGAAEFVGDILIEQFDFEGADRIAERLRKMPQIQQLEAAPQGLPTAPMAPGVPTEQG